MELTRNRKLMAAAAAGLAAGSLYLLQLRSLRQGLEEQRERVPVLAASASLGMGETLTPERLTVREVPRSALPLRAILPQDSGLILGRTLLHPLPQGETLLWTDLPEGPRLRFNTEGIPSGFRAMALPADEVRTVSHLLAPGDRVDITWSRTREGSSRLETTLLAERVLVLAVGGKLEGAATDGGDDAVSTITLLVKPGLGLALVEAMQTGEIFFLVRNREDAGSTLAGGTADPPRGGE